MVYFISIQELLDRSLINENTDPKLLLPAMKYIQDFDIGKLLGECLYNELKNQVETKTLTPSNEKLLNDYIIDCMVWGVMSKAIKMLTFKYWNKGMLQKNSDNSQIQTYEVIDKLERDYRNDFEQYLNELYQYLEKNKELYTSYNNCHERFCLGNNKENYNMDWHTCEINL